MHYLSPHSVLSAMNAAIKAAKNEETDIAVSIVDSSGHPIASIAMPEAFLASVDYAHWKAWTAVSFKTSTHDFATLLNSLDQSVRDGLLAHKKVTSLPGGLPIYREDKLIGGIGVSGGTEIQDKAFSAAACSVLMG